MTCSVVQKALRIERHYLIFALLGIVWLFCAFFYTRSYYPGFFNDDAQYVLQARTLASQGRLILQPGYLPGYSLMLAPVVMVSGNSLFPSRVLSALFLLASAFLFLQIAVSRIGALPGLLAAACYLFSPAVLTGSTTLLSDPFFTFLALLSLWLYDRLRPGGLSFLLGIILGYSAVVRFVGITIFAGILASLILQKRSREALHMACAFLCAMALASPVFLHYYSTQVSCVSELEHSGISLQYPLLFLKNGPLMAGTAFLGLPSQAALAVMVLIMAGALYGAWQLYRQRGFEPVLFVIPLYLAFISGWPVTFPRYFYPLWPFLIMLLAFAWNSRPRVQVLIMIIIMAVPLHCLVMLAGRNEAAARDSEKNQEVYRWIGAHSAPGSVIWTQAPYTMELLSGRKAVTPPQYCRHPYEMFLSVCEKRADYVHCDFQAVAVRNDSWGFPFPRRADLWFDSSTHTRRVYADDYHRLYQWQGSRESYIQAFHAYYRAAGFLEKGGSGLARQQLRKALSLDPDFPEARSLLACVLLESSPEPPAEAVALLESVVRQYPVDLVSAYNLACAYKALKRFDDARTLLNQSIQRCSDYDLRQYEPHLRSALKDIQNEAGKNSGGKNK